MKYLIYGAYGFTGKLITKRAVKKGHDIIIAGRNAEETEALANEHKLPFLAYSLDETKLLDDSLREVDAVLHCAGPYSKTALPMMDACIRCGVHYLDITGELEIFELAASKSEEAKKAGIVIMPGVGFDVVPTDCLASYLKSRMPDATHLEMGFKGVSKLSRGTALTMAENMHKGGMIREGGELKSVPAAYKTRQVAINGKPQTFVSIPWGDVSTSYHSTAIPNIVLYTGVHPKQVGTMRTLYKLRGLFKLGFIQRLIQNKIRKSVKGPNEQLLNEGRSYIWGEVSNESGEKLFVRLETMEGYRLTSITAVLAMEKLLTGNVYAGFKTPSLAFGPDFVLEAGDTIRTDGE
ncbi:MAG: saccharopine dehydrogenase NADP-binding domain-containing protein [Cyclobacteriaceae bacterium]